MTHVSASWQRLSKESLKEALHIPLFGSPPPFPWEVFLQDLQERYHDKELQLALIKTDWVNPSQWKNGLGKDPFTVGFEASSLRGKCFLATSCQSIKRLTLTMLSQKDPVSEDVHEISTSFSIGFFHFLLLEVLESFARIGCFPGIAFSLSDHKDIPEEPLLSLEIALTYRKKNSSFCILIQKDFLASFRDFFSSTDFSSLNPEVAARTFVPLSFIIGSSVLRASQWKKIQPGDFLIVEKYGYNPKTKEGKATLMLKSKLLASCKIQGNSLELLEEPYEEISMNIDDNDQEQSFPSSEEDNGEALHSFEEEAPQQGPSHREAPAPSLSEEICLTVCVEIARIEMALDKVLSLQPGNVIDLSSPILDAVVLTIGGKAVAKGELLQLGETLGVKITGLK